MVAVAAVVAALAAAAPGAAQGPATTPRAAVEAVRAQLDAVAQDALALQRELDRSATPTASLTDEDVIAIAGGSDRLQDWIADHPVARTAARFETDEGRWTVSYIAKDDAGEESVEAVVLVSDPEGAITEVRTGPQVAWSMARGYPGAFGRAINRESIWIFLMLAFFVPLVATRSILSWRTLDLLVLLSFSISLIWFNRGEIFTSVPLAYPPLLYLGARLAWIGLRRRRTPSEPDAGAAPARSHGAPHPRFAGWAPTWVLFTALGVVLALRYGLNAFDSNVIDVGYAGVIGGDRISNGITPYGTFPDDCGSCDTYGPLTYIFYVPFEAAQPWLGEWDSLPAAHGAATAFDVITVAGMIALGWSLAGMRLGAALGLAWAAFPFTGYALATNSNDSLIAAVLVWGLVAARYPAGRGLSVGLATAAKFGPAILIPLWSRRPFPRAGRPRRLVRYAGGLGAAAVLTGWVLLLDGDDGVRAFWSRTVGYQGGRDSPFSIWGQYAELRPLQLALMAGVALAALAMFRYPRELDLLRMTALSGALIIGVELTLTHWFYLYIPWFLPFALLAFVPEWRRPRAPADPLPPRHDAGAREQRRREAREEVLTP